MHEALAGDLDHVSVASLLQLAESDGLFGHMEVARGRLTFADGALTRASFLALNGADAALELLVRARGPFRLLVGGEEPGRPLANMQNLIIASFQALDDLQRFGPMVLAPDAFDAPIAKVADGERSVAGLVVDHELHLVDVLPTLSTAHEQGRLRPVGTTALTDLDALWVRGQPASQEAPPEPAPAVDPESFDDLVFDARKLARARRFDDAERKLQLALGLRPGSRIVQQNLNRVQALKAKALT